MNINKKLPCHYPWSTLYISPNGDVRHCCNTNLTKLGNLTNQTIDEIWNGEMFKTVRKKISKGDFEGAYCNPNCPGLVSGKGYPWPNFEQTNPQIEGNENLGKDNFLKKKEEVDHMPLFLSIEFTNNCNLRCKMCFYEFKTPYDYVQDSAIEQILKIAPYARNIALMGGEVFMNKQDIEFIRQYSAEDGATFSFISNGTFFDQSKIELLKKFKSMNMQISLDGTKKEIYETIRRRGEWELVDNNVKQIVAEANKLKPLGYNWNIGLAYVVMATNFNNIADSVLYAINLNVFIGFYPLRGFHLYDENIFIYKSPFKQIGDWEKELDKVIDILNTSKEYQHSTKVIETIKELKQFLNTPKINISLNVLKVIRLLIPGKDNKNAQGLTEKDRYVGHFIEVYYNWRIGKTSLKSTLSYLIFKGLRKIKSKFHKKN